MEPVHLGPPGQARGHPVPVVVARDLAAKALSEIGPLGPRPDQRHLPAQHVHQLRELIQVRGTQPLTQRGKLPRRHHPAGIGIVVLTESAELDNLCGAPVARDPDLAEEHRMTAPQPDDESQRTKQRGQGDQQHSGGDHVEGPLQERADDSPALPQRDEGDAPHLIQAGPWHGGTKLVQPGNHADVHADFPASAQDGDEVLIVVFGKADDDAADAVPVEPPGEGRRGVPERAVTGRCQPGACRGSRMAAGQVRVVAQQHGDLLAGLASAHQQRRLSEPTATPGGADRRVAAAADGKYRSGGPRDQAQGGPGGRPRQDEEHGQRYHGQDPPCLVGHPQADAQPVQPADREGEQHAR